MLKYDDKNPWRKIQAFLPEEYHYNEDYQPKEEVWKWKGNQIHIDRFQNPEAKAKIICLHGVGTNGRLISMIMGGPMARSGYETISPDMPTYGISKVNPEMKISYQDWVECGSDLINRELERDSRPIFLYGLSAGGMQAYHVACKNGSDRIKGIIGMTFLDQRLNQVRMETTNNWFWGSFGTFLAEISCKIGLGSFKMKMSIPSKMKTLVNNKECLKIMLKDPSSAGNKVSMRFLESYMNYSPEKEARDFDLCPILLTQPKEDRWTPKHLSDLFLNKIDKVSVEKRNLPGGSHYPIEKPALEALNKYSIDFIEGLLG